MLPIYQAISFQTVLVGGRTKPWLILADTGDGFPVPYVMKIFDARNLEARDHVTAEVVGNILAREFDLPVPEAAFIEIDEYFLSSINDKDAYRALEQADARVKFASRFIPGHYRFQPGLDKTDVEKIVDIQTLFAFDNLIRNRDRNKNKPNLLVLENESFLIDHEMGLELDKQTLPDFINNKWDNRFIKHHIAYEYLAGGLGKDIANYFNTFEEYLRHMNLYTLQSCLSQLHDLGYSTERQSLLLEYLTEIKNNSVKFVNLLKLGINEQGI